MKIKKINKFISLLLLSSLLTGCNININITKPDDSVEIIKENEEEIVNENISEIQEEETMETIKINENVYDNIIRKYYNDIVNKNTETDSLYEKLQFLDTNTILTSVGYIYKDINEDNIKELIIAEINDESNDQFSGENILNIYTYVNGNTIKLLDGSYNNNYKLMEDNTIYNFRKNNAYSYTYSVLSLKSNSDELMCINEYTLSDKDGDVSNLVVYDENNKLTDLNSEDFFLRTDILEKSAIKLILTPFIEYDGAKPIEIINFLQEKITPDTYCAVGYLGECEDVDITSYLKNKNILQKYPFIKNIDKEHTILGNGNEWYLLLPIKENTIFTVVDAVLNEEIGILEEGNNAVIFNDMKPILIKCNVSEIMPEMFVIMENQFEAWKFNPSLNMVDGSLQTEQAPGCIIDITPYEEMDNMALETTMNPLDPEYQFYITTSRTISTPNEPEFQTNPVMIKCLKDNMTIDIELIHWTEYGIPEVDDLIEVLYMSKGDVFFVDDTLRNTNPSIRITGHYTLDGIEKEVVWYSSYYIEDTKDKEHISGL